MTITTLFFIFIIISIFTDIKYRKIFNVTTFPIIILGIILNFYFYGFVGLQNAFLGIILGFFILIPFYLLGGIGAGDVKYLMSIGGLMGYSFMLIGCLYGMALGFFVGVFVIIKNKNFKETFKNIKTSFLLMFSFKTPEFLKTKYIKNKNSELPYAAILSVGMLINYFLSK